MVALLACLAGVFWHLVYLVVAVMNSLLAHRACTCTETSKHVHMDEATSSAPPVDAAATVHTMEFASSWDDVDTDYFVDVLPVHLVQMLLACKYGFCSAVLFPSPLLFFAFLLLRSSS